MTCYAYAPQWSEGGAGWPKHRCGGPGWLYAREARGGRRPLEDIDDLIALRRLWSSGAFGGPPRGTHRHRRGRARRGDVRLALLRLLAEEPRNGYQMMQAIEQRSEGLWRPSPGSVYPTLAQLEDEGLIRSVERDGARLFELTDAGRRHVEERADEPTPWAPTGGRADNAVAELAPLVIQIGKAAFQVATAGDSAQRERAQQVLMETRRALYRILAEDEDEGDEGPETA